MNSTTASRRPRIPGVSVYPRGKKWAYIIYREPDVLTGKRERVYRGGFETEDAAWAAAVKARSELDEGRHVRPSQRTVQAFLSEWLDSIKLSVKPTTYANYDENIQAYVVPTIGKRRLQEITVPVLNAFYRHLLEQGRRKPDSNTVMYEYWRARQGQRDGLGPTPSEVSKACDTTIHAAKAAVIRYRRGRVPTQRHTGLSPKSVRNIHRLLHRALKDAVAWQYLSFNPAEHASLPRLARPRHNRPQPWTVEELAAWLRVAVTDRFAGMWVLAATTGMRRSELAGVERGMLDLDTGTLRIAPTRVVVDGHAEDSDGKTDSGERTVSLDSFTVAALRKHLDMLDTERTAFGSAYPLHGKLMVYEDGRQLHPDTVTRRFNRLVDAAGARRIRLHDIRHTYSTLAMDAGIEPKIVSDRVGHANMTVTFQIYTHRSTGRDRDAAERMAGLIEKAITEPS